MSFSAPETPSNEFQLPQDEWGLATKLAIASISSQVDIQMEILFVKSSLFFIGF